MEIEERLRENFVKMTEQKILEIIVDAREVQICNREGSLLALRKYAANSPVDRTVRLLMQLIQGSEYGDRQ